MRELTRENLLDILYGCAILGTGGGGTLKDGIALIDEALEKSKKFLLADFDEVDPDTLIGTPYYCGAISPLTEEEMEKFGSLPEAEKDPALFALEAVEKYLGKDIVISGLETLKERILDVYKDYDEESVELSVKEIDIRISHIKELDVNKE